MRASETAQKKTLVAREQDRPDVKRHRIRWRKYQKLVDPSRLVFIDETWTKSNMTRLYGWAPRGRRPVDKVPHGHWKTSTFLAALRCDRVEAPCLFEGPIHGEALPRLRHEVPGPGPQARRYRRSRQSRLAQRQRRAQAIRSAGARLLFLPKYSPDLNPIEQVFAKLKTLVRRTSQGPSTRFRTPSKMPSPKSHQANDWSAASKPGERSIEGYYGASIMPVEGDA